MNVTVSGDGFFLRRYRGLLPKLTGERLSATSLPSGHLGHLLPIRVVGRLVRGTVLEPPFGRWISSFDRRALGFTIRSRQCERQIYRLTDRPDFVLHVFGSFVPFNSLSTIPYGMYLDYTMALAKREWPPWASFRSAAECDRWLAVERQAYQRAACLFTMGDRTRRSVIEDYGIDPDRVTVVGSAADFDEPFRHEKAFGTGRILFQGSEWERKGGDLLLDAFRIVRSDRPDATLWIVGTDREIDEPGVTVLGTVSRDKMTDLYLASDLVVAPARCDPFTAFVIEAMNYGVPCVVTAASGISDVLTDGVDAAIVASLDPAEIARRTLELLGSQDRLAAVSSAARQTVSRHMNWQAVAAAMAPAIRQAVQAKSQATNP